MTLIGLFLLAVGLSMDAFAVAVCAGFTMPKINARKALIIGLYFGVFQAFMPLIGFMAAAFYADRITAYDHWAAFALLGFLGVKMISGSFKKESGPEKTRSGGRETSVKPAYMLPLAFATSIDALAAGVSFAFLRVDIVPAVSFIGITTCVLSLMGVKIGNVFGTRFKPAAERMGGVILILIGVKILFEHLVVINI